MEIAVVGERSKELCMLAGHGTTPFSSLPEASGKKWDLIALSRRCGDKSSAGLSARCLLLPGDNATPSAVSIPAQQLVIYGFSPRNTITLSSFNGSGRLLCLQRSVITLDGTLLEPQEFPLSEFFSGLSDEDSLLLGGLLLLASYPAQ